MEYSVDIRFLPDGRRAKLTKELVVEKHGVIVPVGFETDFASIPRYFWRILPPWDKHIPASIVHDYLYRNGLRTRKEADLIFLDLMKDIGVSAWKRNSMYWAVRLCGKSSYKS